MSDIAIAWINALTARGVTLQARGRNVGFAPKSAYNGTLTNEERAFYKAHKAEIVATLRSLHGGTARPEGGSPGSDPNAVPATAPKPEPEPCRWCYRTPCIGPEHPAFADLHPDARPKPTYDLAALRRGNEGLLITDVITSGTRAADDEDAVMLKHIGRPLPDWWWQ